ALLLGIPSVLSGSFALILARAWVIRRAFVPPRNLALGVLRSIDRIFQRVNNSLGRGILIFNESSSLPDVEPIAWRETHKRALGQFRYLLRVFLLITVPATLLVVLIIIRESTQAQNQYSTEITAVVPLLWLVSALLICVSAAGLISGERSHQTLSVLLATPLKGPQIILEKLAGTKRLVWVCTVPLVSCILFEAYWRASLGNLNVGREEFAYWEYLVTALSMVWIYPRLLAWMSLWIGLKAKTATRATLIVLIALVAWCMLPIIIFVTSVSIFSNGPGSIERSGWMILLQFSPFALLIQSEFGGFREFSPVPYLPMTLNCLWYGTWWLLLRWRILSSADRLLGRTVST
ncbi:MAG: gliding motility-associated transporter permease protein, partial [Planctomycetaceae bacterium]|nr:gliding motility-associated transporter permease protein [Planctomycetaceae bacterium]